MSDYGWIVRHLIEMKGNSGKGPFGSYKCINGQRVCYEIVTFALIHYNGLIGTVQISFR